MIETRPGGPGAVRVRFARRPLLLAVSGVIVLAGLAALGGSQLLAAPASRGVPVEPRPPAPEIALTDHEGRPFRLSAHRGAPVLLYFGYTNCKDVCPITLATWAQVARILGPNAERVRFLLVSVDPTWDTPERLRAYLGQFDRRFVGLTGPLDDVERVVGLYGAYVKEEPRDEHGDAGGRPVLRHTAVTYAIDRSGRLAMVFRYGSAAEDLAHELARILRE